MPKPVFRVLLSLFALAFSGFTAPASAADMSLETLWSQGFVGKNLKFERVIYKNTDYTRYGVSYLSNGLKVTGVMNVPSGKGPFPVVILAHGYIDPDVYVTGQGMIREQEYLAKKDFIAFHVDYRNHAGSDDDPNLMKELRYGYVEDVINAALAVKASPKKFFNKNQFALFGRSMGGGVTYSALVSQPNLFDAGVVWASVSTRAAENVRKWMANDPVVQKFILSKYGDAETNPAFWNGMSSTTYFDRISDPILVEHGTADDTCPIKWADTAVKRLRAESKTVKYSKRVGASHTFYDSTFDKAMANTVKFLKQHLAG